MDRHPSDPAGPWFERSLEATVAAQRREALTRARIRALRTIPPSPAHLAVARARRATAAGRRREQLWTTIWRAAAEAGTRIGDGPHPPRFGDGDGGGFEGRRSA